MKTLRMPLCTHRLIIGGLNLERFLNTLRKERVPLRHVRRLENRALECECFTADLPYVRSLAQEKGWRVQAEEPLGLSAVWAYMRLRPGVPAGMALALVAALTLSQFIWQVNIHGAGPYHADVEAYLQQSGYCAGRLRRSIDAKALERALTYRYPDIAWFRVYATGVTLVVDVTRGVSAPALPSDQPGDVVAVRDGVVQSVRVSAGTAVVKAGDIVQAGEVLIRGAERAADGTETPVHAQGAIQARCWQSVTVRLPLWDVASQETGREAVFTRIRTPFGTFPPQQDAAPYLASNTYIETTPVVGSFFPIAYERIRQREVSMEYVPRSPDQVRAEAEKAAFLQLKNQLFGYEIIDKWVDYCMIENETLALSATAEWLMDISGADAP